jgi:hypothetical protein
LIPTTPFLDKGTINAIGSSTRAPTLAVRLVGQRNRRASSSSSDKERKVGFRKVIAIDEQFGSNSTDPET